MRCETKLTTEAGHLRRLADWHRAFAETTGSMAERDSRLRFATYLDRLAAEKDAKGAATDLKSPLPAKH